jgi:hypothetical protein
MMKLAGYWLGVSLFFKSGVALGSAGGAANAASENSSGHGNY